MIVGAGYPTARTAQITPTSSTLWRSGSSPLYLVWLLHSLCLTFVDSPSKQHRDSLTLCHRLCLLYWCHALGGTVRAWQAAALHLVRNEASLNAPDHPFVAFGHYCVDLPSVFANQMPIREDTAHRVIQFQVNYPSQISTFF